MLEKYLEEKWKLIQREVKLKRWHLLLAVFAVGPWCPISHCLSIYTLLRLSFSTFCTSLALTYQNNLVGRWCACSSGVGAFASRETIHLISAPLASTRSWITKTAVTLAARTIQIIRTTKIHERILIKTEGKLLYLEEEWENLDKDLDLQCRRVHVLLQYLAKVSFVFI